MNTDELTRLTDMALEAIDNEWHERAATLAAVAQAKATAEVAHWLNVIAQVLDNDNARDALAQSVALYGNGK